MLDTIFTYLGQPSTWRGLISIVGATGLIAFTPETTDLAVNHIMAIVAGVMGVNGLINVVRNEKVKK